MSKEKVLEYFDNCLSDYEYGWGLSKLHSIHYGLYDDKNKTHESAADNYNYVMSKFGNLRKTYNILDAGCGVGSSAVWLAKNIGCNVTGINIHRTSLDIAKKYAVSKNVHNKTRFIEADYLNMPFEKESFDVVWAIESVCQTDKKELFLKEAFRVLKNGGKLIVADFYLCRKPKNFLEKYHLKKWCRGWAMPNIAEISWFESEMKNIGFTNVTFKNITKNVMPSSKMMHDVTLRRFIPDLYNIFLGKRNITQFRNSQASFHQYYIIDKVWQKCIFYGEKK